MLPFTYAASAKALQKGARHLVIIAPSGVLSTGKFPKGVIDSRTTGAAVALAADVSPGRRGAMGATMLKTSGKGDGPRWLHVGALPDKLSRYNTAARADSIRHVLAPASFGKSGKVGILLVLDKPEHALPAVNAIARAMPTYTSKAKPSKARVQIAAVDRKGKAIDISAVARVTAECARDSAALVDTPPSELNPDEFSVRARAFFKVLKGVKVTEIKGDKLLAAGLGGIHAVGRGASTPPRLVIASLNPTKKGPHIVLVGKGVTFDTGGLHIKPRGGMEGMKCDMGGAAAVLGAFRVLARTGFEGRVTLLLCMAENAVDERSYKPDDILKMHSGKTVEINNTDAEGRLLLADGLSYGARELKGDVLINAATLTGAQLISTGTVHAAIISNDAELEALALAAGQRSGDLAHPLPFAPELYQAEFRSPVADMRNSVANRANAQSACAAQFCYSHIEDAPGAAKRRWCHIDLAGPAFPKDRATGFGVALIAELVRSTLSGG